MSSILIVAYLRALLMRRMRRIVVIPRRLQALVDTHTSRTS